MNDITLTSAVDNFRSDVPEPDAAHLAAARERILATTDLPRARREPSSVVRFGRARPLPVLAAAATVAIAIAAGSIIAGSIIAGGGAPGDADRGRPPETLVAVMQRAAAAVPLESGPGSLTPGQFWYSRERITVDQGIQEEFSTPACTEDEWWWGVDGPRRTVTRECADSGKGPILEEQYFSTSIPEPDPAASPLEPDAVPPSEPDTDLRSLPTDPGALLNYLTREAENGPDEGKTLAEEQFIHATVLLSDPDAPPALRSAVFEVMPLIDGVLLVGPSTDGLGRSGVAIAGSIGFGERAELVIEPDAGRVLGQRTVVTDNDPAHDRVTHDTSYVVEGVVTSTDERL